MNFFDKILNNIGLSRKAVNGTNMSVGIDGQDPVTLWLNGKKMSAQKAMRLNTGWVYASVRAIAEAVSAARIQQFKILKDGTHEEVFEHELIELLNAGNEHQSGSELRYQIASHLQLTGNAYILLSGVKDSMSKPTALYVLNPANMSPIKAPLPEFLKGYKYEVSGYNTIYQTHEIIHIKIPDPNDPYEGLGVVQAITDWIDTENFATEVNRQYFVNGAKLSGLLKMQQTLTPEQLEYLRLSFERVYKGAANAYKVGILPSGTDYQELGNTPKDMDFANLSNVSRDKILAGFRVPKTILGAAEGETNRATAETANYVFSERTIKPLLNMIVNSLNEKLAPRFGDDIVLGFEDPTPQNREIQISEMSTALSFMSTNEARERYYGLPPVENGNTVMTDFSKVPLGEPIEAKKQIRPVLVAKTKNPHAKIAETKRKISQKISEKLSEDFKSLTKEFGEVKKKDITSLSDDEFEVVHKRLLSRVTPQEKAMAEAVRKYNDKQKEEVLKNLPDAVKSLEVAKNKALGDLFNPKEWITILTNAVTPIALQVFRQEGAEAASLIGQELPDPVTPERRRALERSMELMSERYNKTTLDTLKTRLEQGMREGLGLEELKERVQDVYEFSNEVRAEMVARTETFRVANDATKQVWKDSGVVKTMKWYTAADERTCEYCGPLHGKVIGIDENFFELGDTVRGSDGGSMTVDYDTIGNPPLHVKCRCYIRPEKISLRSIEPEVKEAEVVDEKEIEEIENLLKDHE